MPRQSRHGSLKPNAPWLRLTKPVPEQVGHCRDDVPGRAPLPWQVRHAPGPDSCSGRVAPRTASSKPSFTSASTSCPRVGPAERARRPPAATAACAAAEQPAQQVTEPAAAGTAEDVGDVERPAARLPAAAESAREPAAAEQRTRLVVLLALGRVRQHVVGLGDLLEPRLGLRVARVLVRVQLTGQLAVRLLDLAGRRRPWRRPAPCSSPSRCSPWCSSPRRHLLRRPRCRRSTAILPWGCGRSGRPACGGPAARASAAGGPARSRRPSPGAAAGRRAGSPCASRSWRSAR